MRTEFTKPIKRAALARSGNLCEAVGEMYGLAPGVRCNASLAYGVRFDHVIADSNGGKATLENCEALCIKCHNHKTNKHDIPRAAKGLRQQDKARGIARPKVKWPSRKFNQPRFDRTKYIGVDE